MKTLTKLAVGLSTLGFIQAASAAVLLQYNFTGADNPTRSLASSVAADVTAGNFIFGPGVGANGYSNSTGTNSFTAPASAFMVSNVLTEPISATSNDYVGFSLTVPGDKALNLESISFSYSYNTNGSPVITTQSANFSLRSSVDNYATSIASFTKGATNQLGSGWVTSGTISLASLSFQGLSGVEFRVFVEDNVDTNAIAARFDNFVLNGSVVAAVPEPSSAALLAGGAIIGFAFMRRRRSHA